MPKSKAIFESLILCIALLIIGVAIYSFLDYKYYNLSKEHRGYSLANFPWDNSASNSKERYELLKEYVYINMNFPCIDSIASAINTFPVYNGFSRPDIMLNLYDALLIRQYNANVIPKCIHAFHDLKEYSGIAEDTILANMRNCLKSSASINDIHLNEHLTTLWRQSHEHEYAVVKNTFLIIYH